MGAGGAARRSEIIHGAKRVLREGRRVGFVVLRGGVGWRTGSIAVILLLLLYLSWVGWWGSEGPQGDSQGPPVGSSWTGRESIMVWAVRLPQNFFSSFTLQGPSSSVLKPDLDQRQKKNKEFYFEGLVNYLLTNHASESETNRQTVSVSSVLQINTEIT